MNPTPFLQALGSNSLQGAVLVVLVLCVQWIFRHRLSAGWRCALWLLPVARLLLPISASSTVSVYNLSPVLFPALTPQAQPLSRFRVPKNDPAVISALPASTRPVATPSTLPQVLLDVWVAGTVILLTRLLVLSFGLARRVRGAAYTDPEVLAILAECMTRSGLRRTPLLLESDAVSTPAVFGFLRPSLLMPPGFRESFTQAELRYIFLHELAHVRRYDLLVNGVMALIQAVHWFNPLVWFGFARWRLDRELACDAFALDALGGTHQHDYGETILRLLQRPPVHRLAPGLIGISEDHQQLKRRISHIARFTPTRRLSALSLGLLGALAAVGLTDSNAQKSSTLAATLPPAAAAASPKAMHTPAEIEAHFLAGLQKNYQEAALFVLADLSSDERYIIVEPREVWKAAPGYVPGTILIAKDPKIDGVSRPEKKMQLVYFPLNGHLTQWGGFAIQKERVLVLPHYTLGELRKVLAESLRPLNQSSEPTPTSGTSAVEQLRVPAAVVPHL